MHIAREMFRVLKPEGRLVVAVFDSLENVPGYKALTKIFGKVAGEEVSQALKFPFSLGDTRQLKSLCTKSGLTLAEIAAHNQQCPFSDVRTMVLADVKGWFPPAGIILDNQQIDEVINQAKSDLKEYISHDGSIEFPMPVHFISAKKIR